MTEDRAPYDVEPPKKIRRGVILFAFVIPDEKIGQEVMVSGFNGAVLCPAYAWDKAALEPWRETAEAAAKQYGVPVRLVSFSVRRDIETIYPPGMKTPAKPKAKAKGKKR